MKFNAEQFFELFPVKYEGESLPRFHSTDYATPLREKERLVVE